MHCMSIPGSKAMPWHRCKQFTTFDSLTHQIRTRNGCGQHYAYASRWRLGLTCLSQCEDQAADAEVQSEACHQNTTDTLTKCLQLCDISDKIKGETYKLLCGVWERTQSQTLSLLKNVWLAAWWHSWLAIYSVYSKGHARGRFEELPSSPNYLSQTPLEAAYTWSLSCTSALVKKKKKVFGSEQFFIECNNLQPGQVYPQDDSSTYDNDFAKVKLFILLKNAPHTLSLTWFSTLMLLPCRMSYNWCWCSLSPVL